MTKFAVFAALLVASTASFGGTYNQTSNFSSLSGVKGLLHSSPFTTDSLRLPKCFPECDGG